MQKHQQGVVMWSKLRVLVVDDDAFSRTVIVDILHNLGVRDIHEASDGTTALQSLIRFQPDLVISDVHMQPINGITLLKHLRNAPNPTVANVRVIFMTGDSSKDTLGAALPLGIRGYIIKPPNADAVKAKIELAMR